ncbi:FO synthase subunit 1, partial [Durusdinium trenchii]
AGHQAGLGDKRSGLVREIFKVYDQMPNGPAALECSSLLTSVAWPLRELPLEYEVPQSSGWNDRNAVPMQQWLALTQTDEDKQRLKAMGNCVVPMMARVAISTLGIGLAGLQPMNSKIVRQEWTGLHKLDQDQLAFDRIGRILAEERDEGVPPKWQICGVQVCLKAWKRLHALGYFAVESGSVAPPCDLRYLKSGRKDLPGDSVRGRVVTFLEQVYTSQAETLPDFRDSLGDDLVESQGYEVPLTIQHHFQDPYAEEINEPAPDSKQKKFRQRFRTVKVNEHALQTQEVRHLPPGSMKDIWEQFRLSGGHDVSFTSFWRTWRQNYPNLKFRSYSSHAICSECIHHKKGFLTPAVPVFVKGMGGQGEDIVVTDDFWRLPPHPRDVILRMTKQWMADSDFQTCHLYLPYSVASVRLPLGVPAGHIYWYR